MGMRSTDFGLFGYVASTFNLIKLILYKKGMLLEDFIRNVHTLFDERPASQIVPSSHASETRELPQPSEVDVMGSNTRNRPGIIGMIPTSTPSSFSSLPSDVALESRLTPSPTTLPTSVTAWRLRLSRLPPRSGDNPAEPSRERVLQYNGFTPLLYHELVNWSGEIFLIICLFLLYRVIL